MPNDATIYTRKNERCNILSSEFLQQNIIIVGFGITKKPRPKQLSFLRTKNKIYK